MELGIEFISVFGLPPVRHVELAAALGCRHISAVLEPIAYNPEHYPVYSLRQDAAMRREMIAAMRDLDVELSLGDGLVIFAGIDVRSAYADAVATFAELGTKRLSIVALEPDPGRCLDQVAELAAMAGEAGMATALEFVPIFAIPDLPTALAALHHVGRDDCRLLIDVMHLCRSGAGVDDLAAIPPDRIGYVQLCDVLMPAANPNYMDEAMYGRLPPGEGDLPLRAILAALPRDRVLGLEVPMRADADAGIGPRERMARCVEATRAILETLPAVAA